MDQQVLWYTRAKNYIVNNPWVKSFKYPQKPQVLPIQPKKDILHKSLLPSDWRQYMKTI